MLKVLIADDKPCVREVMKNIINWDECGFIICGDETDDDDTYQKSGNLNLDSVLSLTIALISNDKNKFYSDNIINLERYIKEKLIISNINVFKVKNKIAIIFYDKSIECIYSLLKKLKIQIEKELEENFFITIGEEVNDINKINYSYESAENLMNYRYLYFNEGIIYNDKINNIINSQFSEEEIINNLYTYIEIGEIAEIEKNFLLLEKVIIEKKYNEEQIKALLTTYYIKLKDNVMSDYHVKESLDMDNKIIIEKIYSKNSLHEVIKFLTDRFLSISKYVASNSTDKGIKRIVKYVDNKYYSDLKLESIAEIFNYNSSYLGKLFKDTTGKNFNTYLDNVRIEEAKKLLLKDKLKVYEIGEKVGYKNIDYFYCKFKKYVGVSPLNYKKTL